MCTLFEGDRLAIVDVKSLVDWLANELNALYGELDT